MFRLCTCCRYRGRTPPAANSRLHRQPLSCTWSSRASLEAGQAQGAAATPDVTALLEFGRRAVTNRERCGQTAVRAVSSRMTRGVHPRLPAHATAGAPAGAAACNPPSTASDMRPGPGTEAVPVLGLLGLVPLPLPLPFRRTLIPLWTSLMVVWDGRWTGARPDVRPARIGTHGGQRRAWGSSAGLGRATDTCPVRPCSVAPRTSRRGHPRNLIDDGKRGHRLVSAPGRQASSPPLAPRPPAGSARRSLRRHPLFCRGAGSGLQVGTGFGEELLCSRTGARQRRLVVLPSGSRTGWLGCPVAYKLEHGQTDIGPATPPSQQPASRNPPVSPHHRFAATATMRGFFLSFMLAFFGAALVSSGSSSSKRNRRRRHHAHH